MSRVSVNAEVLKALIEFADGERVLADRQFSVTESDDYLSQFEFETLVAALDIREDYRSPGQIVTLVREVMTEEKDRRFRIGQPMDDEFALSVLSRLEERLR